MLEPREEVKMEAKEESHIDVELLSTGYSDNSMIAEDHKDEFLKALYDLFRSEDRENFGHISYGQTLRVNGIFLI